MVAQLSTSGTVRQLTRRHGLGLLFVVFSLPLLGTAAWAQGSSWEQPSEVEQRIEPLSPIDDHFMANQRADIEALANRLGQRLSGQRDRDLNTLQTLLDRNMVAEDDVLTLQAMGIVLGDLLADELNMHWVVYRDRAGRSRALQYQRSDVYLFPVTMISRRREAGNTKPVRVIFDEAVASVAGRLPGARWR